MSGEPIDEAELFVLFEAARWAPSAGNTHPWRILYAHRDTEQWPLFFDLLVERNKVWCVRAVGAAAVHLADDQRADRQAAGHAHLRHRRGVGEPGAAGHDARAGRARHGGVRLRAARVRVLGVPDDFTVEAMAAVGKPGRKEELPEDFQARELPNTRKPLTELVFEGRYQVRLMNRTLRGSVSMRRLLVGAAVTFALTAVAVGEQAHHVVLRSPEVTGPIANTTPLRHADHGYPYNATPVDLAKLGLRRGGVLPRWHGQSLQHTVRRARQRHRRGSSRTRRASSSAGRGRPRASTARSSSSGTTSRRGTTANTNGSSPTRTCFARVRVGGRVDAGRGRERAEGVEPDALRQPRRRARRHDYRRCAVV